MRGLYSIAGKNIKKRPGRSIAMIFLAAVLGISVFAGTVITQSLQNGFRSLNDRLGADIMVVPYEAITKKSFENVILQGNTGYFYMDGDYYDELKEIEGVGRITPQYYLASTKSGCCSARVQIIGYDPDTDFVIRPWIRKSNGEDLGYMDVVVGNDLNAFVGDTLTFFDADVNVAAKLEKTGTAYDTCVFCSKDTIQALIEASVSKQLNEYANLNSGNVVSCILIDVADGYDVEAVMNDINIHHKKIEAVRTTNMIAGISDSLDGVVRIAGILTIVIWAAALLVMIIAFIMITGERKKEFAVMRVLGASRRKLSGLILTEGMALSMIGGILGVAAGLVMLTGFSQLIEELLALPFLLPGAAQIILAAVLSLVLSAAAGALASGISAYRIGRTDTGIILRSGE